jgi:SAM-dependent methyltransferase
MNKMRMDLDKHFNLLWRFDRGLSLREAVFENVKKGDIVIDAGCGTGILSLWAAQAGAHKVIAVDNADITIGVSLASENNLSDRIEFIQADLLDFKLPKAKRGDVLLSMIYFNDPRRDKTQTTLLYQLKDKVLHSGGRQIPDRVTYIGYAIEWLSQDIKTRFLDIDRKIIIMEQRYGLALNTLAEATKSTPNETWFPVRKDSGLLERANARFLSNGKVFADINYKEHFQGYPEDFKFSISQPGVCNAILFEQKLYSGKRLIFSNESLSWVYNPLRVESSSEIRFAIDERWYNNNIISLEKID